MASSGPVIFAPSSLQRRTATRNNRHAANSLVILSPTELTLIHQVRPNTSLSKLYKTPLFTISQNLPTYPFTAPSHAYSSLRFGSQVPNCSAGLRSTISSCYRTSLVLIRKPRTQAQYGVPTTRHTAAYMLFSNIHIGCTGCILSINYLRFHALSPNSLAKISVCSEISWFLSATEHLPSFFSPSHRPAIWANLTDSPLNHRPNLALLGASPLGLPHPLTLETCWIPAKHPSRSTHYSRRRILSHASIASHLLINPEYRTDLTTPTKSTKSHLNKLVNCPLLALSAGSYCQQLSPADPASCFAENAPNIHFHRYLCHAVLPIHPWLIVNGFYSMRSLFPASLPRCFLSVWSLADKISYFCFD